VPASPRTTQGDEVQAVWQRSGLAPRSVRSGVASGRWVTRRDGGHTRIGCGCGRRECWSGRSRLNRRCVSGEYADRWPRRVGLNSCRCIGRCRFHYRCQLGCSRWLLSGLLMLVEASQYLSAHAWVARPSAHRARPFAERQRELVLGVSGASLGQGPQTVLITLSREHVCERIPARSGRTQLLHDQVANARVQRPGSADSSSGRRICQFRRCRPRDTCVIPSSAHGHVV